eukprot:ANDGO_02742.mRNA.1 hypothetical protein ACA1_259000
MSSPGKKLITGGESPQFRKHVQSRLELFRRPRISKLSCTVSIVVFVLLAGFFRSKVCITVFNWLDEEIIPGFAFLIYYTLYLFHLYVGITGMLIFIGDILPSLVTFHFPSMANKAALWVSSFWKGGKEKQVPSALLGSRIPGFYTASPQFPQSSQSSSSSPGVVMVATQSPAKTGSVSKTSSPLPKYSQLQTRYAFSSDLPMGLRSPVANGSAVVARGSPLDESITNPEQLLRFVDREDRMLNQQNSRTQYMNSFVHQPGTLSGSPSFVGGQSSFHAQSSFSPGYGQPGQWLYQNMSPSFSMEPLATSLGAASFASPQRPAYSFTTENIHSYGSPPGYSASPIGGGVSAAGYGYGGNASFVQAGRGRSPTEPQIAPGYGSFAAPTNIPASGSPYNATSPFSSPVANPLYGVPGVSPVPFSVYQHQQPQQYSLFGAAGGMTQQVSDEIRTLSPDDARLQASKRKELMAALSDSELQRAARQCFRELHIETLIDEWTARMRDYVSNDILGRIVALQESCDALLSKLKVSITQPSLLPTQHVMSASAWDEFATNRVCDVNRLPNQAPNCLPQDVLRFKKDRTELERYLDFRMPPELSNKSSSSSSAIVRAGAVALSSLLGKTSLRPNKSSSSSSKPKESRPYSREYLLGRIRELWEDFGNFKWNSGSSFSGRDFSGSDLPTDAEVVMHVFLRHLSIFVSRSSQPDLLEEEHFLRPDEPVPEDDDSRVRNQYWIRKLHSHPPYFDFVLPKDRGWRTVPGEDNVFQAMVLLVHFLVSLEGDLDGFPRYRLMTSDPSFVKLVSDFKPIDTI